MEPRP